MRKGEVRRKGLHLQVFRGLSRLCLDLQTWKLASATTTPPLADRDTTYTYDSNSFRNNGESQMLLTYLPNYLLTTYCDIY